ncbi:hypothetical protein [Sinanaerobacter chloroacetimidivorans]|uniref:Uncharacterized protein n=1 Tax=Sinanaerobacter chloroacetimidivorans TaxID=2818044 RepID=A0A8J8B2I8_9FIRM|nr:hypothetical protein [Sinanaerobacter chloroacetimidivorans]MBR0599349.1 hypothetical protein [Sinanaerobacter chloroacetimidivorans]
MSRNKFILLVIILAGLYYFSPDDGLSRMIKVNAVAVLPYILIGLILYLAITIHLLKRAWKKLDSELTDENVVSFSKMMNISFDVVRMLGGSNLLSLYNKVNFADSVSVNSKKLLYEAMRRKRLDVAPPGQRAEGIRS